MISDELLKVADVWASEDPAYIPGNIIKRLAARVRELEAELDSLRCPNCDNLRLELGALRHDIKRHVKIANEYMRDALRYRWLRDGDGPESARWSRWRIEHWASPGPTWSDIRNADLDAAIDQARKV